MTTPTPSTFAERLKAAQESFMTVPASPSVQTILAIETGLTHPWQRNEQAIRQALDADTHISLTQRVVRTLLKLVALTFVVVSAIALHCLAFGLPGLMG
jgi:hypothetical protein